MFLSITNEQVAAAISRQRLDINTVAASCTLEQLGFYRAHVETYADELSRPQRDRGWAYAMKTSLEEELLNGSDRKPQDVRDMLAASTAFIEVLDRVT